MPVSASTSALAGHFMADSLPTHNPFAAAVTLKTIAERCGVSHTTVMRALSGHGYVAAATRQRIEEAAREMGYNPAAHQAARRMGKRRFGKKAINQVLALLLPPHFHASNYFAKLLHGMQSAANAAGFATIVTPFTPYIAHPSLPPIFASGEIDAVVGFFNWPHYASIINEMLAANQMPVPLVGLINKHPSYSVVRADEELGAYQATQHLLAGGHRRILLFAHPEFVIRYEGAARAVREAGLDPAQILIHRHWYIGHMAPPYHLDVPRLGAPDDPERHFTQHVYKNFLAFMHEQGEITAIMAVNDAEARRIGYLLLQAGYRIPDDISLVGFDDVDAWLDGYGQNILTTVQQPLIAMGERAVSHAIGQIHHPMDEVVDIVMPTTLTVRQSTRTVTATHS